LAYPPIGPKRDPSSHTDDCESCSFLKDLHIGSAPHLSSGQERSPVAEIIVMFKLVRGLVP
jgi:hypothetical protein